jgi:GNAT superfamily N-acetyltransferase
MSKDVRKALMIAKGPVSSGYLPLRHIAKAGGGSSKIPKIQWTELKPTDGEQEDELNGTSKWSQNTFNGADKLLYGEAFHGPKKVGRAMIGVDNSNTPLELDKIWVHPDHRRTGIATRMIEQAKSMTGRKYIYSPNALSEGEALLSNFPRTDIDEEGITKAEGGVVDEPVEHDTPEADAEMQQEAMPLEYKESGFGLHQFVNNNIGFVGGTRTGKPGTEGTHRLGYAVYDTAHPSGKPTPVGKADLNFHPETKKIEGIVNLEFDKQHRGKGYGTRAVKALAASNPDGLQVYDIKKSAKPFWAKMGAEFRKGDPKNRELASQTNAAIPHEIHKAGGGSINKAEGGEVDTNRNAAFKGLASAQRGDPEMAMVKAQGSLGKLNKSGTSVLSSLLEHVGDLTHRISQYPASQPSLALENAPPKIKKALMALRPYTRDRMDLEDHVPSDMPELKEYADAHAALPVYNDMQRHARDAAVALGNKDFNAANAHLTKLHDAISDGSFGNRIMEFNSPIAKAEGGPVDDPSDPDYHAKVHQDLMWHSAHNRSSNYGAALYHHLMKQPDQGPITKFYEQTVYPILKNHGFPKPPEGPGDVENPKYLQAVSDVVKNWRDVPRNKEDVHKAEGGAASLPVLPERPPLDVLRRMDAGAKDAWRRDRDVRLGRNYHPPGSPEHDANLMDFMEGAHPLFFKEPGVPRPVYHATNKDIRRFIPGGTAREEDMESGPATWLTFDPTNNPAAHHIGGYKGEYKEGTNVMPLYANIKNPLILNNKDALKAARNKFSIKSNAFPMLLTKDTKNALQEAGHDGIVYQKEAGALDGDEVLAFDNHQLKSALGNRGVYDKQDPTVDYQRGGYITKAEGGPIAAPVGGFPGMKAMPTLSAPQNSQATQAMMAAIPRMQESGPVSNTGYAPYTPTALPQRLAAVGVQPKVVPMSAEVTALMKQYPTATKDQLSELDRSDDSRGGDPASCQVPYGGVQPCV